MKYNRMSHKLFYRCTALLTVLSLLLPLAACGKEETEAATMHLVQTEGTVDVSNEDGEDIPLLDNLGLYSGYEIETRSESYAWINLDDVKLTKMDQESEISIDKEDGYLKINVRSGSLFFNVTEPLEDDETMEIRSSSMIIGIRGTCGWVENPDGLSRVYLLEGEVECSVGNQTATVNAGEMAELAADGTLTVTPFTVQDIPAFALSEVTNDAALVQAILDASGIDVLASSETDSAADAPETDLLAKTLEGYRTAISHPEIYVVSPGTTISYRYALVQMLPEDTVPTLLLEHVYVDGANDSNSYIWCIIQYDPEMGGTRGAYIGPFYDYSDSIVLLSMMGDGNGIQSRRPVRNGDMISITISTNIWTNGQLIRTPVWEGYNTDEIPDYLQDYIEIEWHDVSDPSALDSWTPNANIPAPQPSEPAALPTDGDRIVFTGIINLYTYDEILALQGISDPNPGPYNSDHDRTFVLIIPDTPQEMNLNTASGDGLSRRTVSIINVSDADDLEQYEGQHLIFSIDPSQTYWPSDTSIPSGQPSTNDVNVLGPAD